jgi:thymidylate synthase ThyX
MRILNVEGFTFGTGPTISENEFLKRNYDEFMDQIDEFYKWLIEHGAKIEDARGVLPTNIHTNIVAKFNLRTLSEMLSNRSSPRTQGEYRDVLNSMADQVLEAHPWAHVFLRNRKMDAAKQLDEFINNVYANFPDMENGPDKMSILKLVDILRG